MSSNAQSETATPKRRRRWLRRIGLLVLVLVVLVVLAPLALALPFVRNFVAGRASNVLGREVTLESASAFWTSGIDLGGVKVASPAGFAEPLATVDKVHVDVDLLGLIGGNVDASIRVDGPRVTLLKDAEGRSNLDGLMGEEEAAEKSAGAPPSDAGEPAADDGAKEDSKLQVHVEVHGGVVRAQAAAGEAPEELSNLEAVMDLRPDGSMAVDFSGTARGASVSGDDVTLDIGAALSGEHRGPVEINIPALDLSKLASVVEGATGIRGLKGTFGLEMKGELAGGTKGTGTLKASAEGIALETAEGVRFNLGKLVADARIEGGEAGDVAHVTMRMDALGLVDASGEKFDEALIELALDARLAEDGDLLLVESGKLSAGRSVLVTVAEPWKLRSADEEKGVSATATGKLDVHVDLNRLSKLQSVVPALAKIRGGRIGARIEAEDGEAGLLAKAGVRIRDLDLVLGEDEKGNEKSLKEKEVVLHLRATQKKGVKGETVPMEVCLRALTTSFLTFGPPQNAEPLTLSMTQHGEGETAETRIGATGKAQLNVNFAALAQALGGVLGLKEGDRLAGTLSAVLDADITDMAGTARATLTGRGLEFAQAGATEIPAANVDGEAVVTMAKDSMRIEVPGLKAFGLEVQADALMAKAPDAEESELKKADVSVTGELLEARSLLGAFLEVAATDRLSGKLALKTQFLPTGGAQHLKGNLTIDAFRWQNAEGKMVLDEPRIELPHDVVMGPEDGRTVINELQLKMRALAVSLKGSATTADEDTSLDATLDLNGDAAQLAPILANLMGPDYADMRGSGPITGSLKVQGSTARGGEALLANGQVNPGDWSVAGLDVKGPVLSVKRASQSDPIAVAFEAGVNGGRANVQTRVRPSEAEMPWDLGIKIDQLDTSPLIVDKGFGQYLKYAMPTLLPSGSDAPVLSGRLDAEINVAAQDIAEPKMEPTLKGNGFIKMSQGAIAQSSLFQAIGGGQGLGQVGTVLLKAVPELGSSLGSFAKSLNFSRMESVFVVANRVVNVQKGVMEGDRTHITFTGTADFDERVNMKVALKLTGGKVAERLAKVLPSKTIPLRVTNTLSSPSVQPDLRVEDLMAGGLKDLIPVDLPKIPGIPGTGTSGGKKKNPLEGLKGLLPR